MVRLLALFVACALLPAMGIASVAHAMEPLGCADVATALSAGHADSDAAPGADDNDTTAPHHHGGCHGHHLSTAPGALTSMICFATGAEIAVRSFTGLPENTGGPAPRPPIA